PTRAVCSIVIVAASPSRSETSRAIHGNRGVAVTNFQVDANNALVSRPIDEVFEKTGANPFAVAVWKHCKKEQFGFVGDPARERKTDRFAAVRVSRDRQRDPGHRQDPGTLGPAPRFTVTIPEGSR